MQLGWVWPRWPQFADASSRGTSTPPRFSLSRLYFIDHRFIFQVLSLLEGPGSLDPGVSSDCLDWIGSHLPEVGAMPPAILDTVCNVHPKIYKNPPGAWTTWMDGDATKTWDGCCSAGENVILVTTTICCWIVGCGILTEIILKCCRQWNRR